MYKYFVSDVTTKTIPTFPFPSEVWGDRRMGWLEGSLGDWIGWLFWISGRWEAHGESGDGRDSPNWISAGNSDGWVGRYISLV